MPNRRSLITLIDGALAAGHAAYAQQVAQRYLADWPGDLQMQLALARSYAGASSLPLAIRVLENLTAADPEDAAAQRLLGQLLARLGTPAAEVAFASAHVVDGQALPGGLALPAWAAHSRAALLAEGLGDWDGARRHAELAVQTGAPSPLPALVQLAPVWHAGDYAEALPLAEAGQARWPRALAFKLCLADCLFAAGQNLRATELLHDAAAQDIGGQVAARHWGAQHPYRSLWESDPSSPLPGPLPAELMAALGYNRLKEGEGAEAPAPKARPAPAAVRKHMPAAEQLTSIASELDALAAKLAPGGPAHRPGRQPRTLARGSHYVLLSSRAGLTRRFGEEGFDEIDRALKSLALSAAARTGLAASVLYVDDAASLSPFGLRPVNPQNAWDIKHLLARLAERLGQQKQGIAALLIVGGPDIIPFHHLPNPTDDTDADIPSDNPYATPDDNYFVPEWPIGRMPAGAEPDPGRLLHALRLAAQAYGRAPARETWLDRLRRWLQSLRKTGLARRSLGYVADVWKDASAAVYNTIGDPRELFTSPPTDAARLPAQELAPAYVSYFNLHGIEDGPEWYGQGSLGDGAAIHYPVALRPGDVVNSGRAPAIVFSEACYGANVIGKSAETALCLRFLECGTRAVIGSTKIAYGSVTTPLIGADLLGRLFWQNAASGLPVGEALRRAKLQMAQHMHDRQGFLDGEDQKTLISFVLYGDPLAVYPHAAKDKRAKRRPVPKFVEPPATVCDKNADDGAVSPEAVAQIKSIVAKYLPGMGDAEWRVAHAHTHCTAPHDCPTSQLARHAKSLPGEPHTTVVTLAKTLRANSHAHGHFARITLDAQGKVIKLAVSR